MTSRILATILGMLAIPGAAIHPLEAAPLQLDQLPVVYYQFTGVGMAWKQQGLLDSFDGLRLELGETVPTPPGFPDGAYDKPLIAVADWEAYGRLSPAALACFQFAAPTEYVIDGRPHRAVTVNPEANVSTGALVNISTRAWVASGESVAIGGFTIVDRPRTVLIRGVGPTLGALGVANPVADPFITVFLRGMPLYESTDWGQWDKAEKIAAARLVSAFQLQDGSKDAALLIELSPGAYTVHMGIESGGPGVGLVEVYVLPDNSLLPSQ
ncbi:MAG: hypothetical protein IAE82_16425 [Opitutaceae bacterium]|nr:hypothetical protein [Opitutaceae bacterium]